VLGFSEQMQSLENILKNPKQRGILGEYFLETLLGHVLQPNQYKMQYKFENGEIVDAAIFFKDKIIPIDAKFSLEKYNKIMEEKDTKKREKLEKDFKLDIKNRIDETFKYIRPKEGTTDFAFMFIPAEGIYYNLLVYKVGTLDINANDLIEYAFKKHVIIVSPTSFFAYLETVLQGLKALKMEESVKEIIKKVGDLGKHIGTYDTYMQKMGTNLGTTVNMYNNAYTEFKKIDKDVYKITEGKSGGGIIPLPVDKPKIEG
jgi:DNA recombination protein RmuC